MPELKEDKKTFGFSREIGPIRSWKSLVKFDKTNNCHEKSIYTINNSGDE
jgi:hypothetical protein